MWIGGIKVPKLINWLQRKFYDSSPDFVANTYRTSEDALDFVIRLQYQFYFATYNDFFVNTITKAHIKPW